MKKEKLVNVQSVLMVLILFLSLLACVKCVFIGMNIDEEYAVTMAYRMLGSDSMFRTMWEPHQTSGFVCAFFMRLFLLVTGGNTDYMMIYLRVVGALLHAGVCIHVFFGLKHICTKKYAFLLSVLCFSILPKWILVPEFSNILLWVTLSMMAFFLQIQHAEQIHPGVFVFPGILTCIGVLAYPSFLICFVIYGAAIYYGMEHKSKQSLAVYISACAVIGVLYILFFAGKLGLDAFLDGVFNMATDGQHDTSLISKLGSNALELGGCICIYTLMYVVLYFVLKFLKRDVRKGLFFGLAMISVLWQMVVWLGTGEYFNEPLFLFYHILLAIYMGTAIPGKDFLVYVLPPIGACFAAGLLTNTGIYVVSVFLLPAIVYGLARLSKENRRDVCVVIVSLLALFLVAKGWLVCENNGYKADVTFVKQKALSGPAKNIYCRYMDGYEYNIVQELMDAYVEDGDSVLCISGHTIWYLLRNVDIANYSTISTPTYDERLLEYYERFPEKYPDVIILHKGAENEAVAEMFSLTVPAVEREGISLYYTAK